MRIRPSSLALATGLVLLITACEPPEQDLQDRLAGWETKYVSCAEVEDYLDEYGGDYEVVEATDTARIRIKVDADGNLVAEPERVAISRGGTIQWEAGSNSLRWTMQFVGDTFAVAVADSARQAAVGQPSQQSMPDSAETVETASDPQRVSWVVDDSARCGLYHYVVGAYDSERDEVYVLDPPIMVKD